MVATHLRYCLAGLACCPIVLLPLDREAVALDAQKTADQLEDFLLRLGDKLARSEVQQLGGTYAINEITIYLKADPEGSLLLASGRGDAGMTVVIRRQQGEQ